MPKWMQSREVGVYPTRGTENTPYPDRSSEEYFLRSICPRVQTNSIECVAGAVSWRYSAYFSFQQSQ
jgi:hypothetical protein